MVINRKTANALGLHSAVAIDQRGPGDRMKRNAGHFRAGLRRRVEADDARRSMRRAFLLVAAAWPVLAWTGVLRAQAPAKVYGIGYLSSTSLSAESSRLDEFRQALRDLGYVEEKNIVIEYRFAE